MFGQTINVPDLSLLCCSIIYSLKIRSSSKLGACNIHGMRRAGDLALSCCPVSGDHNRYRDGCSSSTFRPSFRPIIANW